MSQLTTTTMPENTTQPLKIIVSVMPAESEGISQKTALIIPGMATQVPSLQLLTVKRIILNSLEDSRIPLSGRDLESGETLRWSTRPCRMICPKNERNPTFHLKFVSSPKRTVFLEMLEEDPVMELLLEILAWISVQPETSTSPDSQSILNLLKQYDNPIRRCTLCSCLFCSFISDFLLFLLERRHSIFPSD